MQHYQLLRISQKDLEGFSRYHFNDKVRFYYMSRGSISEVKNCLILAKDLEYMQIQEAKTLIDEADRVLKLINGLIRSVEK